jgi:FAD/FMN-containing dehydrogenase/Fe-S oxidoreductase
VTNELAPSFIHDLETSIAGELRVDKPTRLLFSTDASIYQIEPQGVVFPRDLDDLPAIMEICASYGVPVLARGSGTSLGGQTVTSGLVVDCSRFLNRLVQLDPESQTALVEPGLILTAMNRAAAKYDLQFGPDPASAERATMGGSLANNAAGAHSIRYGMAADHLLSVEAVLADGSLATFESMPVENVRRRLGGQERGGTSQDSIETSIYRTALQIRDQYGDSIKKHWPRTWRRASGYNLNYLLPWAPSKPPQWEGEMDQYPPIPPGSLNLATLIAGSEGTLAIIRRATIRLVPLPQHTVLGVLAFRGLNEACDAAPGVLERNPSAVELIPQSLVSLARSVPTYASQLSFLDDIYNNHDMPPTLLVVEFSGANTESLRQKVRELGSLAPAGITPILADTADLQARIWAVRKVGLGLLLSRLGDTKPWPFIEDLSVQVEFLGEFIRQIEEILSDYGTQAEMYGHASAGCLHIRPLLNLKTDLGLHQMREIAERAVDLTLSLGGSVSGEHGDGLARTQWYRRMFGDEILEAFHKLKASADPMDLLNPGKMSSGTPSAAPPSMDQNLRFGRNYQGTNPWNPVFDFGSQSGLQWAIEQCNGAGVCRKDEGVMCPSFQATREEKHSTRGRANLLRAMISGKFTTQSQGIKAVEEALDLCLACKGCKAECPSAVDMAKLKYEFFNQYYRGNKRKPRDYLFGYIGSLAALAHIFSPILNLAMQSLPFRELANRYFGLAPQRQLPHFSWRSLRSRSLTNRPEIYAEKVLFLSDAFSEYFYPKIGEAAIRALNLVGCEVRILPVIGAGRTLISKSFLATAKRHAQRLIDAIRTIDPDGTLPVVGIEPSEIYTLRDEYLDFMPGDSWVCSLAERAYSVEEFLLRPRNPEEEPRINKILKQEDILRVVNARKLQRTNRDRPGPTVLLHGHCYQKAQSPAKDGIAVGGQATVEALDKMGYRVSVIESGCCGMAGAFGYESEHYDLSIKVGELALFPAIRQTPSETIIAAAGISCRTQIHDGTGREVVHPVELIVSPDKYDA